MIEKLKNIPLFDVDGKMISIRQPSHLEVMQKINEIIEYVNSSEKKD